MGFIAFFASCIGPAFWTLVAEMFPNRIRGQAVALASFTQWVFNFLVVLLFPYMLDALGGSFTFLFLSVMSLIQLIMVTLLLKETKGKSLEEIEQLWKKRIINNHESILGCAAILERVEKAVSSESGGRATDLPSGRPDREIPAGVQRAELRTRKWHCSSHPVSRRAQYR